MSDAPKPSYKLTPASSFALNLFGFKEEGNEKSPRFSVDVFKDNPRFKVNFNQAGLPEFAGSTGLPRYFEGGGTEAAMDYNTYKKVMLLLGKCIDGEPGTSFTIENDNKVHLADPANPDGPMVTDNVTYHISSTVVGKTKAGMVYIKIIPANPALPQDVQFTFQGSFWHRVKKADGSEISKELASTLEARVWIENCTKLVDATVILNRTEKPKAPAPYQKKQWNGGGNGGGGYQKKQWGGNGGGGYQKKQWGGNGGGYQKNFNKGSGNGGGKGYDENLNF